MKVAHVNQLIFWLLLGFNPEEYQKDARGKISHIGESMFRNYQLLGLKGNCNCKNLSVIYKYYCILSIKNNIYCAGFYNYNASKAMMQRQGITCCPVI